MIKIGPKFVHEAAEKWLKMSGINAKGPTVDPGTMKTGS